MPLTDNQIRLLDTIAAAPEPVTMEHLGRSVRNGHGDVMGENAVRSSCKRMEGNGWITGSGTGRLRKFAITAVGLAALEDPTTPTGEESPPPPEPPPANSNSGRDYIVLEEMTLETLQEQALESPGEVKLYVEVTRVPARNVEAALRHAAKEHFEDGTPRLVAVSEKMW